MDANHPVTLVLCVITAFVTVVAVGHFAERWIRPSRGPGWPTVVVFAVAVLAFGAGAFLPDVSPRVRALAVAIFLLFAFGSIGTVFQWPGFRPQPPQDEDDGDNDEGDEEDAPQQG
jgi:uncharacterized membrane protein YoaK (UPF0700 family)